MLTIEIFSDVICPWCFIGKRRLDKALDGETGVGVTVRWRPYQLYPHAPIEGWDRQDFMQRRYGAAAESGRVPSRIREEAEQEGLELRYDLIRRVPNTLLAHRLMELAELKDSQHALAEALFVGYFCNGEDVGDIDTQPTNHVEGDESGIFKHRPELPSLVSRTGDVDTHPPNRVEGCIIQ